MIDNFFDTFFSAFQNPAFIVPSGKIDVLVLSIQLEIMIPGLIFSAVFSGSEVAYFSLTHRIGELRHHENPHATDDRVLLMLDKSRRLLATILIGNTFTNIMASVMAVAITGSLMTLIGFSEVLVYAIEVVVLTFMIPITKKPDEPKEVVFDSGSVTS